MEPITRKEMYLASAAGYTVEIPQPITREEKYLYKIATSGGSGGGGSATPDWNAAEGEPGHVLNRTHYSYKPYEDMVFDNVNVDGLESLDGSMLGLGTIYKISDYPLTADDFAKSTVEFHEADGDVGKAMLVAMDSAENTYMYTIQGIVQYGILASIHEPGNYLGLDFSRGTYITMLYWYDGLENVVVTYIDPIYVPLHEKFIPSIFAKADDVESKLKALEVSVLQGKYVDDTSGSVPKEMFYESVSLREVSFAKATNIGERAFYNCDNLKKVNFPNVKRLDSEALRGCASLRKVHFPLCESLGTYALLACDVLEEFIAPIKEIYDLALPDNKDMKIVLTRTDAICKISLVGSYEHITIQSFKNYKFYVPAALLESYKADSLWGQLTDNILTIEGSEYEQV